ncbi:MAG TPA: PAS domain-containing sensor histidine kinase, partial [Nitrosopumilaceae archaeon]|nr:PAS domain-containing sensor histidine kinase [Nitrosopumilaceae archaeon]
ALANSFNLMSKSLRKSTILLSKTEQQYKKLYEGSPTLLRTIDLNGIVIDCNESYANQLGYTKDELIGRSIFETTAEKSIEQMHESLEIWKNTGHVENREIWLKKKNDMSFPALLSATNLYDENGKLIGSNTAIRDISDIYYARKKLEENEIQIREQYEQLKNVNKIKEEFLAMITHELKTPLVPIKGYIDMLLSEQLGSFNETQKQKLEIIRSSTNSLLNIISDLLDAQKIELGQLRLSKNKQDVTELINATITKLKLDLEHGGIDITTELESVSCNCDKVRIEEVLGNLITNAIDFCPKTNGKVQIKSHLEDPKHVKITVKDNGIGIQKDKLGKIFVKFYQIDASTTREHGGTGLGLSVCKGIIESHGGKIWAESEGRGKGTTIHILLPLE